MVNGNGFIPLIIYCLLVDTIHVVYGCLMSNYLPRFVSEDDYIAP